MTRIDNRVDNELRKVRITLGYQSFAEGSALIELGQTRVLCSVSMEERVPPFLKGSGNHVSIITAIEKAGIIPHQPQPFSQLADIMVNNKFWSVYLIYPLIRTNRNRKQILSTKY